MLSLKPPGFFGGPVPATALAPAEADGGAPVTPAAPDSTGAVEQPAARGAAAQPDTDWQEASRGRWKINNKTSLGWRLCWTTSKGTLTLGRIDGHCSFEVPIGCRPGHTGGKTEA